MSDKRPHGEEGPVSSGRPRRLNVFISYRRDDTAGYAKLLYDPLKRRFGRKHVFMDVDSVDLGDDFVEVISEKVAACHALIALIGRGWLTATDEAGRLRLDNPEDFVRIEIEAALERKVVVIPVLVDSVEMPTVAQLPPSLAPLARRHAATLDHLHFDYDIERLIRRLERIPRRPESWRTLKRITRELGRTLLVIPRRPKRVVRELIGTLRRRWKLIVTVTVLAVVALGLVVTKYRPGGNGGQTSTEVSLCPRFHFSPAVGSPVGGSGFPDVVAVGDFNGDNHQDLAVAKGRGFGVLLGDRSGGFKAAKGFRFPSSGSPLSATDGPESLTIGDFNEDGRQDVAFLAEKFSGSSFRQLDEVNIVFGEGNGDFAVAARSFSTRGGDLEGSPMDVTTGDFNGDHHLDLAVANSWSHGVSVLLGNGSGDFKKAASSPFEVGGQPISLAIGDFDGDSHQDLAVVNHYSNSISVLLNDGSAGFEPAPRSPFKVRKDPSALAIGDFNGDGHQDLAVAEKRGVSLLLGNGLGSFHVVPNLSLTPIDYGTSLASGDFNGDGSSDLAWATAWVQAKSRLVSVVLGSATDDFLPAQGSPFVVGKGPHSLAVGDFNGDGHQDLAVANAVSDSVSVLLGACG